MIINNPEPLSDKKVESSFNLLTTSVVDASVSDFNFLGIFKSDEATASSIARAISSTQLLRFPTIFIDNHC